MRFLADGSCDFALVRALRVAGHDVLAVAEITPRAEDAEVIDLALGEGRMVLTEDKDFGRLVYAHGQKTGGVILLRYPVSGRMRLAHDLVELVNERGDRLIGCFVVIQPGRVRISRIP